MQRYRDAPARGINFVLSKGVTFVLFVSWLVIVATMLGAIR
jgi:hypothetical protein